MTLVRRQEFDRDLDEEMGLHRELRVGSRQSVLRMVMGGALSQAAMGLALGIPLALAGGRLIASKLYGVKSYDPVIVVVAGVILTGCALLAGFVPARRAARVDPVVALRNERSLTSAK